MKRILLILALTLFFPWAWALADDVTTDADITIELPSDGTTYTLKSGSGFNAMGVDSGTISFTGGGSASVDLRSGGKKNLTNNRNISTTCSESESSLTIPATSGNTTVTPSGTCGGSGGGGGTSGGGGGGGGGGGFGSSPTAPAPATVSKVADLKQQLASIQSAIRQKIAQGAGAVSGGGTGVVGITRDLAIGSRGEDVTTLQQLLAQDKELYPEGTVSGYFGPATSRAVRKFQEKYGLPAVSRVGPQTRAKLSEVFGGQAAAVPPVAPQAEERAASVSAVSVGIPSRALNPGERNDEVSLLQRVLAQDKELYPEGTVSGYFGPLTARAVERFQLKYGVISVSGEPGTGRFGPKTKAKFEEIFGSSVPSASTPAPSAPGTAPQSPASSVPTASSADLAAVREQIQAMQAKLLQQQIKLLQEKINAIKQ